MKRSPSQQKGGKGQSESMKENPWLTFNQSLPCLTRVQLGVHGSARCQELSGNTFVTAGQRLALIYWWLRIAPALGRAYLAGR